MAMLNNQRVAGFSATAASIQPPLERWQERNNKLGTQVSKYVHACLEDM